MGASVRLPGELTDFLRLPGPQSLLIRGPPGSGKTTLCLALLEAFQGSRFFVTNRVPGDEVFLSFPWLGENGTRGIQVVDNSTTDTTLAESLRFLMNQATSVLREDGAQSKELREFLWLPEPLQETWSRLDPTKPSLVIVDSWDALVESYAGTADGVQRDHLPLRNEIERALLRRMGKTKAHIVFVLEREDQTQLDYLVNGVTVTHRDVVNERLERWLTLLKLRGVRIENASYPFSLESAHFECILPVRPYGGVRGGRFDPSPDAMPGHLWPGSRAFADSFGRLPLGKATLVELDRDVPSHVPYVILGPMVAQAVDRGGRVLFLPDPSTMPDDVWDAIHGGIQRRRFLDQVRFLMPPAMPNEPKSEFERTVIRTKRPEPGAPPDQQGDIETTRFIREGSTPESPGLIIVFVSGLIALAASAGISLTPEIVERLPGQLQGAVRGQHLHAVVLGTADSTIFEPLRSLAALRLHARVRQGRVFVYGSDPWTPSFVLTEGNENAPYGLLRVV